LKRFVFDRGALLNAFLGHLQKSELQLLHSTSRNRYAHANGLPGATRAPRKASSAAIHCDQTS
jgi:hypothetical protein